MHVLYLRSHTRNSTGLVRMVIYVILAGVLLCSSPGSLSTSFPLPVYFVEQAPVRAWRSFLAQVTTGWDSSWFCGSGSDRGDLYIAGKVKRY